MSVIFKILPRYLASNFVIPFLLSTLFFVGFMLTFQMFKVTSIVINKDISYFIILKMIYHMAISFLPLSIPLSVLFSTIFTLHRMSEDSEIIVMRSLGLSLPKILGPFLVVGLMISILTFSLNTTLIPVSKGEFKKIIVFLTSKGFLADIKEGQFYTDIKRVTIFSNKLEDNGNIMNNIFIHQTDKNGDLQRVIYADKGVLEKKEGLEFGQAMFRFRLFDGVITKYFETNHDLEKISFEEYDFPISTADLTDSFVTKDSMLSSQELWAMINRTTKELKEADVDQRSMTKTKLEFWTRINTPLLCFLFVLLGFCLGLTNARGKRRNTSVLCFIILIAYYSVFFTGVSFAKKGQIEPFFVVFGPTFIGFFVAYRLYKRLEWVS